MTSSDRLVHALYIVEALASAGLIIRFLLAGLYRAYPFFFAYLMLFCLQVVGQFFFKPRTNAYAIFFFATEAAVVILYVLVTLELYSLILADLKGIASVARWYIRGAIVIAILCSLLLLEVERTPGNFISRFFSFERPIVSSLIVFVFLITGFLVYYPIPLSWNVIHYSIGYAIYFSSKAAVLLFSNTGQFWNPALSLAMLAVSTSCLVFWLFSLTSAGERKLRSSGVHLTADEEAQMLRKLAALNQSLLRTRKGFSQP